MNKIIVKESGQWYWRDGSPAYEVENKSKGNGAMRKTTLADAKKLDLVPSVTTFINILAKPFVIAWEKNQILLSAATSPHKRTDMSADKWASIVLEDAQRQAKEAMEKGKIKHAQIESYFNTQKHSYDPITTIQIKKIVRELHGRYGIEPEDIEPEKSFASPWGFGGKMDLPAIKKNFIADIKTTEFTIKNGEPYKKWKKAKLAYPEHILQLSGYAIGTDIVMPRDKISLINIYVSTVDSSVHIHEWSYDDFVREEHIFMLLRNLWWARNLPKNNTKEIKK